MNKQITLLLSMIVFVAGVSFFISQLFTQTKLSQLLASPSPVAQASTGPLVLGARTKIEDCHVNGPLPDPECSPGAVFPEATAQEICQSGYSKSVRNVSQATKDEVFAEY